MGEVFRSFSSQPTKEAEGFNISQSKFTKKAEEIFRKFQNNELYSDLILVCDDKDGTFQDSVFQVHQILVATRSEYIERAVKMIKQVGMANQGKVILYLDGISKRVMELILDFIYSGNAMIPKSCFQEFMTAANKLEITGLFKGNDSRRDKTGSFENLWDQSSNFEEEKENSENCNRIKTERFEDMDTFALNTFEDTSLNNLDEEIFLNEPKTIMGEDFTEERPKKIKRTKIGSNIKRKQAKEVNILEFPQVSEGLKVQVKEVLMALQSMTEKFYNKQNRTNQCSECPSQKIVGLIEMKRHVTRHMKSTPGYENIPKKLKEIAKNLADDQGFCILCNKLQSSVHFLQRHLARKYLEPALGSTKFSTE